MRKRKKEPQLDSDQIEELFKLKPHNEIHEQVRRRIKHTLQFDMSIEAIFKKINLLILNKKTEKATDILNGIDKRKIRQLRQRENYIILQQKIAVALGRHDQAKSKFEEYISNSPESVSMLISMYMHYTIEEDPERAKEYSNMAITLDPSCSDQIAKMTKKMKNRNFQYDTGENALFSCATDFMNIANGAEAVDCLDFLDKHKPGHNYPTDKMRQTTPLLKKTKRALNTVEDPNIDIQSGHYRSALDLATKVNKILPMNYHALMTRLTDEIRKPGSQTKEVVKNLTGEYFECPELHKKLTKLSLYRSSAENVDSWQKKIQLIKKARVHMITRSAIHEITGNDTDEGEFKQIKETEGRLEILKMESLKGVKIKMNMAEAKKLFDEGKYDEVKEIIDKAIDYNRDYDRVNHTAFELRLRIALNEGDTNLAHKIFGKLALALDEKSISRYKSCLNQLEQRRNTGKIGTSGSIDNNRGRKASSGIWDTLGSREPADSMASIVTGYKKWRKSN